MGEINKEGLSLIPTENLLRELKRRWSENFFFVALENNIKPPYPKEILIKECSIGYYDYRLGTLFSFKKRIIACLLNFYKLSNLGIK